MFQPKIQSWIPDDFVNPGHRRSPPPLECPPQPKHPNPKRTLLLTKEHKNTFGF
ncbi:hypothetical protein QJS04_geneDACA005834 [Acorus gramineus]|uniref:Uncharacterized protein n=1 Tax=Acorus gramineus TaxID=55184 RepID=A0AAV9B1A1_ACOGR|nr:hypothetical protein QJS04_geneDACA005834 [Acorus gramineus]